MNNQITLDDLKSDKKKLCHDVLTLVQNFEEKHGLSVASIYLEQATSFRKGASTKNVNIEVRI